MTETFKIALVQLQVGTNKDENIRRAVGLVEEAAAQGAALVMLPEMFSCPYEASRFKELSEPVPDGPTCRLLAETAKRLGIHLAGGSIPESRGGNIYNTATLFDPDGRFLLAHRKVHLFDIQVPGGVTFKESKWLSGGDEVSLVKTDLGTLGLAICYDLRFPELFRIMALGGADLILLPGSFNTTTGPPHWEVLIRTRAIENTTYLAACGAAPHPEVSYPAWGHSMVADPFGDILAAAGRDEEIVYAAFDRKRLEEVRRAIPVLKQRRPDVYGRQWIA